MTPKAKARQNIDALLVALNWYVWYLFDVTQMRSVKEVNSHLPMVCEVGAEVDTNVKRA